MKLPSLLLVDWGMGTIIIGIFAIVCIAMVAIVLNLAKGNNKNNQDENYPKD